MTKYREYERRDPNSCGPASRPGRGRHLTLAISSALALAMHVGIQAEPFPAEINLADLDGSNGFVLNGEAMTDRAGASVSTAGDVNGDGINDLIIGAYFADPNGNSAAGRSYVVFGSNGGLPSPFNLSSLNGTNGFIINGEAQGDFSGTSVSNAGDFNDDGFDDVVIGAGGADPNGSSAAGRSYVVFGSDSGLSSPFNLADLNGSNGFALNGEAAGDNSGEVISAAGDINGDGIEDLIISTSFGDPNGNDSGRSYVVFGSSIGLPHPFNLSSLNGLDGFIINGANAEDRAGSSVSAAGDFNGDGIDDLIIGAPAADTGPGEAGISFVVFGSDSGLPSTLELSDIDGTNGIVFFGEANGDFFGSSVSAAGDVNGDGLDDVIIGASGADPNGEFSGRSYVVFGSKSGLPNPFYISSLNGSNGFALNGEATEDFFGFPVSAAGDINGDGVDDLIIGAGLADPNGTDSGRSYVVFGSSIELPHPFDLSSLNGLNGFVLNGEAADNRSGESVSAAGDINGDGIDDLIVGALRADSNGNTQSGRSYVVLGRVELVFRDGFEGE